MKKIVLFLALYVPTLCFAINLNTSTPENQSATLSQSDILPVEKAFAIEASMKAKDVIEIKIATEPGYKLYRNKIQFFTKNAALGSFTLPKGQIEHIPALNETLEIYDGFYSVLLPVKGQKDFTLYVQAQGCANVGVCYPPFKKTFNLVNK